MERITNHINDVSTGSAQVGRIAMLEVKTRANGSDILLANQSTITRYQYSNHLGSACLELDENAEILSYEEFHPFGSTSYSMHTNDSEVSLKRYKYNGKERDDESGLDFYGARYYAPWLCRFISCDPLGMVDAPSLYAYVRNNPIILNDPNGMQAGGEDEEETNNNKIPQGDLLNEKGEITKAGKQQLSNYPKKVVHAVEEFAKEVQGYLEENKDSTLDEAIDATNLATQDEDWVYVQIKMNNNHNDWQYKAYHAGLVYKTLNFQKGSNLTKSIAAMPDSLSDQTVNGYFGDNFSISREKPPLVLKINNDADSTAMILDLYKQGRYEIADSTIAAGDSVEVNLTPADAGTYLGVGLQVITDMDSARAARPRFSWVVNEKQAGKGLRFFEPITSTGKLSKEFMKKEFFKLFNQ